MIGKVRRIYIRVIAGSAFGDQAFVAQGLQQRNRTVGGFDVLQHRSGLLILETERGGDMRFDLVGVLKQQVIQILLQCCDIFSQFVLALRCDRGRVEAENEVGFLNGKSGCREIVHGGCQDGLQRRQRGDQ